MEIIQLSGYTEFEKLNIAVKYLVPRQRKECGLEDVPFTITRERDPDDHPPLHEGGGRPLARARDRERVPQGGAPGGGRGQGEGDRGRRQGRAEVPRACRSSASGKKEEHDEIGLTNGLSVTSNGGGELLACEVAVVAGKGKLVITGLLEKGMEESAQAAMSYVRSRAEALGLEPDFYQKVDVHVHFPEFVRKDGPSAGVTMATSLASALIKVPVKRDLAMTGEITLRGRVMPIGGAEGEAPRGAPERDHDGHRPEGEPEGPARGAAARAEGDAHRARRAHGRGAARGAVPADAGRAVRAAAGALGVPRGELVVIPGEASVGPRRPRRDRRRSRRRRCRHREKRERRRCRGRAGLSSDARDPEQSRHRTGRMRGAVRWHDSSGKRGMGRRTGPPSVTA